jgi:NitT/TauT family transport system ATP-binding protein
MQRRGQPPIVALNNVTLHIPSGWFVAIVGPSGCGKSTLVRLGAGLLRPSRGTIRINSDLVTAPRSNVGFVFQQPTLLPWRSVLNNVLLPATIAGGPTTETRRRAEQLLDLVGLTEFRDRYPAELSGGMQQRAAIARALLMEPDVLLLDEPFAALDALLREDLAIELERIWLAAPLRAESRGRQNEAHRPKALFVTHSIPEAVMLADVVVVLSPRPGTVIGTIPVDLPRPRGRDVLDVPEFAEIPKRVRRALQSGGTSSF